MKRTSRPSARCRAVAIELMAEYWEKPRSRPLDRQIDFFEPLDTFGLAWDNPTMIVTLDAKRRVSIPVALAPAAPGDQFDASFDAEDDVVILRRIKRKANWLEVWKQCPVEMDDLPPRSRELPKKL